jgi:hypothetical protein
MLGLRLLGDTLTDFGQPAICGDGQREAGGSFGQLPRSGVSSSTLSTAILGIPVLATGGATGEPLSFDGLSVLPGPVLKPASKSRHEAASPQPRRDTRVSRCDRQRCRWRFRCVRLPDLH